MRVDGSANPTMPKNPAQYPKPTQYLINIVWDRLNRKYVRVGPMFAPQTVCASIPWFGCHAAQLAAG